MIPSNLGFDVYKVLTDKSGNIIQALEIQKRNKEKNCRSQTRNYQSQGLHKLHLHFPVDSDSQSWFL